MKSPADSAWAITVSTLVRVDPATAFSTFTGQLTNLRLLTTQP